MKNIEESTYEKAIGYYYYEDVPMKLNGELVTIKVKKYRKGLLSAQKRLLKFK